MSKNQVLTSDTIKEGKTIDIAAHYNDYVLAQKAAGGDMQAFEQIYWQQHRCIYGICLRMTKNTAEAEDITQQIFVQLLRKIKGFRGDSALKTWLYRMTVNHTLMYFRQNKLRKEEITEDGELPEGNVLYEKKPKTERVIDNILLNRAIAKLPDGYRKTLILYDVYGYEHEEIAQILGCAVGTSKSQLYKARRKLRKILTTKIFVKNQNLQEIN